MENIPNKTQRDYKLTVKTSQTFKSIFLTFISTRFSNGFTSICCSKNLISEDRLTLGKHIFVKKKKKKKKKKKNGKRKKKKQASKNVSNTYLILIRFE
jgi:hypothetical protein